MKYIFIISYMLAFATTNYCSAQENNISVRERGSRGYWISVQAERGSDREQAGLLAMSRACEIANTRNFPYLSVNAFRTNLESTSVQTSRGGIQYHGGTDGRPVGATTTNDQTTTVSWGSAFLSVTVISADAAGDLAGGLQIINARTCTME